MPGITVYPDQKQTYTVTMRIYERIVTLVVDNLKQVSPRDKTVDSLVYMAAALTNMFRTLATEKNIYTPNTLLLSALSGVLSLTRELLATTHTSLPKDDLYRLNVATQILVCSFKDYSYVDECVLYGTLRHVYDIIASVPYYK